MRDSSEILKRNYPHDERPWVPRESSHCRYVVCHRCNRKEAERGWVSLDGVLNGDIAPSLATGLAFSLQGSRPVADAIVVARMGLRAVPLVYTPQSNTPRVD
jgi:hypothetical protein